MKDGPFPLPHEKQTDFGNQFSGDQLQRNPDQSGQDADAAQGEEDADQAAERCDRRKIPVADSCDRNQRIPDGIPERADSGSI